MLELTMAEAAKRPRPYPAVGELSTQAAVVYERATGGGHQSSYFACHRRSRRRVELTRWTDCGCSIADVEAPPVWLSGRFAAVSEDSCSSPNPQWGAPPTVPQAPISSPGSVWITDLRSARERRVRFERSLAALILGARGSLAFVDGDRLLRSDRTGTTSVDTGPGSDPGSLATNGKQLHWLPDGQPRGTAFD
jgi:hypothetical protein